MSSTASAKTINHPSLGKIKGAVDVPGITTFLNVQYATLPYGRFTQSVLRDRLAAEGEEWDATKPGYFPSQKALISPGQFPRNH
jgi:hypothetical protein